MLAVDNLHVRYGSIAALRGVSLTVDAGELVAVVGQNGAGKSSLLLAIAGVLPKVNGAITLEGRQVLGTRPEDLARMDVSLVPEGRDIFGLLTVEENLRLGAISRHDQTSTEEAIERELDRFPVLKRYFKANAGKLSGGEQQQLAIARGLLSGPRLLLLDEPSLGLAPKIVDLVFDVVARLPADGVSVLLVEQMAHRAVELADRSYVLQSGEIVATGSGDDVQEALHLATAFRGRHPS